MPQRAARRSARNRDTGSECSTPSFSPASGGRSHASVLPGTGLDCLDARILPLAPVTAGPGVSPRRGTALAARRAASFFQPIERTSPPINPEKRGRALPARGQQLRCALSAPSLAGTLHSFSASGGASAGTTGRFAGEERLHGPLPLLPQPLWLVDPDRSRLRRLVLQTVLAGRRPTGSAKSAGED